MNCPFVVIEGKKRYKKLMCYSFLLDDEGKPKTNKLLGYLFMIKDNKKYSVSPVPMGYKNIEDALNHVAKGVEKYYKDETGITISPIDQKEFKTLDVYFETY